MHRRGNDSIAAFDMASHNGRGFTVDRRNTACPGGNLRRSTVAVRNDVPDQCHFVLTKVTTAAGTRDFAAIGRFRSDYR